jgi:hypothetical protein
MASKRAERDEFIWLMAREYGQGDLLFLLRQLMRLAKKHHRLAEQACNEDVPEDHRERCETAIRAVCAKMRGCIPVFSGDPRGATVKLRLPSGRTNDWGGTGVCIPQ